MGNQNGRNQKEDKERLSENPLEFTMDIFVEMVMAFVEGVKKGMGISTGNTKKDPMEQMQAMMENMMQMFQGMQNMQMQNANMQNAQVQKMGQPQAKQAVNPQMPNMQMPNMQMHTVIIRLNIMV